MFRQAEVMLLVPRFTDPVPDQGMGQDQPDRYDRAGTPGSVQ
jgi:hypothetical protein